MIRAFALFWFACFAAGAAVLSESIYFASAWVAVAVFLVAAADSAYLRWTRQRKGGYTQRNAVK
jgi:membrane protein implicated in regulation of membrane protease activity